MYTCRCQAGQRGLVSGSRGHGLFAWALTEAYSRAASRSPSLPDAREPTIGFRLAADPEESAPQQRVSAM